MTWSYRPAGAICVRCQYRPARLSEKFPDRAVLYCSDRCRALAAHSREDARRTKTTNAIRILMGLPDGRGAKFTGPELDAILRRLQRLVPAEGLRQYPARRGTYPGCGALTAEEISTGQRGRP